MDKPKVGEAGNPLPICSVIGSHNAEINRLKSERAAIHHRRARVRDAGSSNSKVTMSTAPHRDHSPSHAGNVLLKECVGMRETLRSRLPQPAEGDMDALAAHIEALVTINRMDHKELRVAVLDSNISAYYRDRASGCHAAKAP